MRVSVGIWNLRVYVFCSFSLLLRPLNSPFRDFVALKTLYFVRLRDFVAPKTLYFVRLRDFVAPKTLYFVLVVSSSDPHFRVPCGTPPSKNNSSAPPPGLQPLVSVGVETIYGMHASDISGNMIVPRRTALEETKLPYILGSRHVTCMVSRT